LIRLATRAKKARNYNYNYFGLQNYGEYWGGKGDYTKYGKGNPSKCFLDYNKLCDENNDDVCVASEDANYV